MLKRLAIVVLGCALLVGCGGKKGVEGESCAKSDDCGDKLRCIGSVCKGLCGRLSQECKDWGRCTARGGDCVATSDAECKQSDTCKDYGWCTAKDGICVK